MNPMAQTLKRTFFGVLGAAAVTSVVAAQTPQTSQTPPQSTTTTQDRANMVDDNEQTITVTGCLKEEADVPGLEPNVAERAGVLEDFILTNARVASGSSSAGASRPGASSPSTSGSSSASAAGQSSAGQASASGAGQSASGQSASGQSASGAAQGSASQGAQSASRSQGTAASAGTMFKIEGLDDDELRQHANHQVEVRGKVDADDLSAGATTPSAAGADASHRDDDVPEIEAESIRMVAASCSAN
jgi:hypothetical protein